MRTTRFIVIAFFISVLLAGCLYSATPVIRISPDRILRGGILQMKGEGFTPTANLRSHLLRPDGTEFPVLPMVTNDRGEITHEIETFILEPGVYEVWVEDVTAKKTSEKVKFEVTRVPPEK